MSNRPVFTRFPVIHCKQLLQNVFKCSEQQHLMQLSLKFEAFLSMLRGQMWHRARFATGHNPASVASSARRFALSRARFGAGEERTERSGLHNSMRIFRKTLRFIASLGTLTGKSVRCRVYALRAAMSKRLQNTATGHLRVANFVLVIVVKVIVVVVVVVVVVAVVVVVV